MPIDTDSEEWRKAEKTGSLTADILDFLSKHPDKAFTSHEIADGVMGTEFAKIKENWELSDREEAGEIDWEDYQDRKHDVSVDVDFNSELYQQARMRKLVEEQLVEVREVDASEVDTYRDEGEIGYYTYALE